MSSDRIAKIISPKVKNTVRRRGCYAILESARDKPAVWVSAPAGAGKTTLVAGFLQERGHPCLWYQMDAEDTDPAIFFYYLGLAFQTTARHSDKPLPLLTSECAHNLDTFARRFFRDLFAALRGVDDPPCYVVLDNYQQLPQDAALHRVVAGALDAVPPGVNVIIISRHLPPVQYARLRANSRLTLMLWEEIRFSSQEARELIKRSLGSLRSARKRRVDKAQGAGRGSPWPEDDHAIAARLHQVADGWAAGLVLLTERMKTGRTALDSLHLPHPPEEIIEYFAEEVCGQLEEHLLDFLTRTALLPRMTPHTAGVVSGYRQAGRILAELNRRNCFTEKRDLHPPVYHYHPLFRDFLLARALEELPGDELLKLRRKAARLLASAGEMEEAVDLLLAIGGSAAARVMLRQAPAMIAEGRNRTLKRWLSRLPETLSGKQPWLDYWRGVCRCFSAPDLALGYFRKAFHRFEALGELEGLLLAWSGAVDAILLERADLLQLDAWVDWLHERLQPGLAFPRPDIEIKVVASMTGAILFRHSNHPRAREWLDRAAELAEDHPDLASGMSLLYLLMYYLVVGDTLKAGLLIKKTEPFVTASAPPSLRIKWSLIKAMYANRVEGAGREAIDLAEQGLAIARDSGIHAFDRYLLAQGAYGGLAVNDVRRAQKYLDTMASILRRRHLWDLSDYHFLRGGKEYCAGNFRDFREHMQLSLDLSLKIGCTFAQANSHQGLALALLEMNETGAAEGHLAAARGIIPAAGDFFEFTYLLVRTLLFFRREDEQSGLETLASAMALGRRRAYFTATFWRPETMSRLCARAIEGNMEPEYVRELIRRRNLYPVPCERAMAFRVASWTYPLKIFTLGRFAVEVHGKALEPSSRMQKKPLDMLKVLIACGGQEVPLQKITDALYPDVDGDRSHYSCKHTLHRLRSLLGSASFIVRRGGTLSFDRRYCYIDAADFLQLCEQIQELNNEQTDPADPDRQTERRHEILGLCQQAMALYAGNFITPDDYDSIVAARERLRRKYGDLVDIAAACLEDSGRHLEVPVLYEKSIAIDELQERFHRRLMHCHGQAGRRKDALLAYDRCRTILATGPGIEPSPETMALYNSLRSG